ncbi:MAG TPA: hypothetical protein VNX86_11615 [Rhizomicrobium sp.]|jgi:hypothetical protein|nr:hypothetical protein [Rhizomicrobium sp.]
MAKYFNICIIDTIAGILSSRGVTVISQCWLHIGTEKTGTTTIQRYLAKNRKNLKAQGFLYPVSPGETNHLALSACSIDDSRLDPVHTRCGIRRREDILPYRRRMMDQLANEFAEAVASSIIFSNEHLSTKIRTPEEIRRVKEICDEVAATTKVIVYLRNQIDFLVSRYGTAIKAGSVDEFSISLSPGVATFLDYSQMLSPWSEIFGRKNLIVRRFEADDFPNGDLLADFAAQAGLDGGQLEGMPFANTSLNGPALAFLREFNKRVPLAIDEKPNPLRGRIAAFLESYEGGQKFSIPRQIAETIEARYRESNDETSREYFGSRFMPLFSPAKCVNSAGSLNDVLDAEQAVAIAAHLWGAQQRAINRFRKMGKKRHEKSRERNTPRSGGPRRRRADI